MSNSKSFGLSFPRPFLMTAGILFVSLTSFGQVSAPSGEPGAARQSIVARTPDEAIDLAIANENRLDEKLRTLQPVIETYVQQMQPDKDLVSVPKTDNYFLGRLDLTQGVAHDSFIPLPSGLGHSLAGLTRMNSPQFAARGFAQMVLMDDGGFDRSHYNFHYLRREFLGDVRCIVYDVTPSKDAGRGRFIGRIWVEDQDYNVVRFNGTYGPSTRGGRYAHFDSWRINTGPSLWLPAFVYSEEGLLENANDPKKLAFKAQTRLWGYQSKAERDQQEFTSITVEPSQDVNDKSDQTADTAPVESLRLWQRQAEDNLLSRLADAGMIGPRGEVDKVVQTVLENLEITNKVNIQPEIRVRVMTTMPMEAVFVGNTIVVSRGLLDVLPDESSLAAVIAHQLGHILLAHQLDTNYAFSDRMIIDDDQILRRVGLTRTPAEEEAADKKAIELLQNSPYKDKLGKAGLFLRTLAARGEELPHLTHPLLGNGMTDHEGNLRMASLMEGAPELALTSTDQISALQIGARVKIDPWSGQLSLARMRGVTLLSATEKKPFEITPLMLHLTRQSRSNAAVRQVPATGAQSASAPNPVQ